MRNCTVVPHRRRHPGGAISEESRATSRVTLVRAERHAYLRVDDVVDDPYPVHRRQPGGEAARVAAEPLEHLGHSGPPQAAKGRPDSEPAGTPGQLRHCRGRVGLLVLIR